MQVRVRGQPVRGGSWPPPPLDPEDKINADPQAPGLAARAFTRAIGQPHLPYFEDIQTLGFQVYLAFDMGSGE